MSSSLPREFCVVASSGAEVPRGRGERTCTNLSSADLHKRNFGESELLGYKSKQNFWILGAREIHLISLYSHWEFGMKPEEFYAKWDVSYEQIALIYCRSDSTVRGWFKQGKFRRYPQPNDLRHLAFMDFLLEYFEEVPEQLWQLLCLTHSP